MWRSSAAAAASASPSRIASWIAVLDVDRRCRLLRSCEGRFIPEIAPEDDGVLVGNAAHFSSSGRQLGGYHRTTPSADYGPVASGGSRPVLPRFRAGRARRAVAIRSASFGS